MAPRDCPLIPLLCVFLDARQRQCNESTGSRHCRARHQFRATKLSWAFRTGSCIIDPAANIRITSYSAGGLHMRNVFELTVVAVIATVMTIGGVSAQGAASAQVFPLH